jgi:hypothetical protein
MRYSEILHENAITDKAARNEAEHVFMEIFDWLTKNEANLPKLLLKKPKTGSFVLPCSKTGLPEEYDWLIIDFTPSKGHDGYAAFPKSAHKLISISCLIAPNDLKYLPTRFYGKKRAFIHEFQHYLNDLRTKGKNKNSRDDFEQNGEASYFNNAEEVNAYYQESAHEMETFMKAVVKTNASHKFADYDTKRFLIFMLSKFVDSGFQEHASEETMRKFIRRATPFLNEIIIPMVRGS